MGNALYIVLGVVALVILLFIVVYNSLIRLKNRSQEAWSDIDVQLKRRYNLIPNLIETVKGYAKHEEKVLKEVTNARTRAMGAAGAKDKGKEENMLSGTLKSLFAVSENYPQLKANENFLKLQEELSDTENKIQAARRFYNGNVRDYNTKKQVFPNNMIVNFFSFPKFDFFEIENKEEKENVKVKF